MSLLRKPAFAVRKALLFITIFAGFSSLRAQNSALVLNGSTGYANFNNSALFNANTSIRTMECWVRFNSFGAAFREIISKSTVSSGVELLIGNNAIQFYVMKDGTNTRFLSHTIGSTMTINTWYHIAVTWNGTSASSMRMYINGVSVGTLQGTGSIEGGGIGNPGNLLVGQWSQPGDPRYLDGSVDEVRIWSTNRTAAQVKDAMYKTLPGNTAGLIAYYNFNEASGTTVNDQTANALNGTMIGGASRAVSPVQFSHNALEFDGVNDYAAVNANTALNLTTGTIEFRAKPTALTAVNSMILGVRSADALTGRYSFHMSNTAIGMWNGSTAEWVTYAFTPGQWYHIAFVCNGTNTRVYVNGTLAGTLTNLFGTATGLPLHMGKHAAAAGEIYNGAIDEVRFWNTVRTQPEIDAHRNLTLNGNEAGLQALYTFDQGISSGTNTALRVVIDKTSNNNHAVLNNFDLTGTASNFIASSVNTILPVTLSAFNVVKQDQSAVVTWQTATEANTRFFTVERSASGTNFTGITTVAAAGNSSQLLNYSFTDIAPLTGKNYYRLKTTDIDGSVAYSSVKQVDFASSNKLSWSSPDGKRIDIRWTGEQSKYQLADMNGRVISKGVLPQGNKVFNELKAGVYLFTVEHSGLPALRVVVR